MRWGRTRLVWAMALGAVLAVGAQATTARAQQPANVRIAAWGLGTAWYVYGAVMADLIRKALPPGSKVDLLPFAGGVGNPKTVAQGNAEIGMAFSVTAKWAYEGKVAYDKPMPNLRGLVGGLDLYYLQAMVTARSGITSLEEVKRKKMKVRLATISVGGLGEFGTRQLLEAYGIGYGDLRAWGGSVTHTGLPTVAQMINDGRADLFIHVITQKHPTVVEITTTTELRFLPMSEAVIKHLEEVGYERGVLPAKSFKGQNEDVPSVIFPTTLIARADLPELVTYAITKAIVENKDALVRAHAALRDFDPKAAWQPQKNGLPLHPGAIRYYREKGLMQ
ncbi:MAG: TAXI family TRAP transporter solute-binding subunit [Deltaproteobacteria bacterium]|nr:TAXI family TRAP transporter solute-binding subunit [Deltaproteobacteria bacterium]MBI3075612.1 TAXI family TRAP transporter solute-binding subunit [Deltaproteobacteria bacterium]